MKNVRNHIESKFLPFRILLLFLFLIAFLFTLIVLFNIQPWFDILPKYNIDSGGLDKELFSKIPITEIITLIAGSLSAILAIVFSLTIIGIESISEKYTPRILDIFLKNNQTKYTLYTFILVIVVSLLIFLVKGLIAAPLLLIYLMLLVFGFVLCFIQLIRFFHFVFDIINPIKFASMLTQEIKDYIKNGRMGDAESIITVMGDITIKSLLKHDEDIAINYIRELKVFSESIDEIKKCAHFPAILKFYHRVIHCCIKINSNLRLEIMGMYAMISNSFYQEDGINTFDRDIFDKFAQYSEKLFYINKEIIDNNDFELFEFEINRISNRRWVADPGEFTSEIDTKMLEILDIITKTMKPFDIAQYNIIYFKYKCLKISMSILNRNFSNHDDYKKISIELKVFRKIIFILVTSEIDRREIRELFNGIWCEIFDFYTNSNRHKTFLLVGTYCRFIQKNENIESNKYIRELWFHTKPDDADAKVGNTVPVTYNVEFLFNMLFWGGKNNIFWYSSYKFKSNHGTKRYLYAYFIIRLTYLLKKDKDLKIGVNAKMCAAELEFKYTFLNQFVLNVGKLIDCCDNLIKESAELKLIDINTDEQLEHTKEWLGSKKTEFEKNIEEINTIKTNLDDCPEVCSCCGQSLCDNLECPKRK